MEDCPIIVVDEAESPTIEIIKAADEKESTATESVRENTESQQIISKVTKQAYKYSSTRGTKALSIKLRELRRSSNYSQSIELRQLSNYDQVSRSRRTTQFPVVHRSRRSLHYSQSIGPRKKDPSTHSAAFRRSSHHPLMELNEKESSPKLIDQGSSQIGSHIRTRRDTLLPSKQKNKEKEDKTCSEASVLPMAAAMLVASCLGGPVILVAGLKLGMFAAMGGGMMGYTTGKIIQEQGSVFIR